jgi:hypothetical protein
VIYIKKNKDIRQEKKIYRIKKTAFKNGINYYGEFFVCLNIVPERFVLHNEPSFIHKRKYRGISHVWLSPPLFKFLFDYCKQVIYIKNDVEYWFKRKTRKKKGMQSKHFAKFSYFSGFFSRVRVTRSLVLYVCFVDHCYIYLPCLVLGFKKLCFIHFFLL